MSGEALRQRQSAAVEQSLEIIRRRIDETGVREPSIQRQGGDRILVQLPGVDDPQRIKALIGKTAKMTFHLLDEQANLCEALAGRPPPGSMVLPSARPACAARAAAAGCGATTGHGERRKPDRRPTDCSSRTSRLSPSASTAAGGKRFGEATSQNVGKHLAIVLDDQVISAPQIREPILGGSGVITGGFSVAEAQDLALLLRAGALPAPLTVLEERTVGPGLGSDSIRGRHARRHRRRASCVVDLHDRSYGLFGLFANLALVVNVIMLVAAMSVLQAPR